MREFQTHHNKLHYQNDKSTDQALIVAAHHDDEKMLNLESALTRKGVKVSRITFTNSDARNLPNYSASELAEVRWQEGIQSALITGVSEVHRIDLPDGKLSSHIDEAVKFGSNILDKETVIFAPNENDKHPDHRYAHMIALMLGGDSIPVHGMDTLDGLDMEDNPLHPDLYVPLTRSSARREKRSYRANTSQVTRIPHQERRAMFDALGMTSRRGSEVGLPHAAVLFNANNSPRNHDPIAELFPGAVTLNNHMQFA